MTEKDEDVNKDNEKNNICGTTKTSKYNEIHNNLYKKITFTIYRLSCL